MKNLIAQIKLQLILLTVKYKEYQIILSDEQELLVNSKSEELKVLVEKKSELAIALQKIEEKRVMFTVELSEKMGSKNSKLTIDDISKLLDKNEAEILIKTKQNLQEVLGRVKALNDINNELLKDSVSYVNRAFDVVMGKKKIENGYGNTGSIKTSVSVSRNFINTKA